MTKRRRSSRPNLACKPTSGTSAASRPALPDWRRSRRTSARWMFWSTTPASPKTGMFHKMTPEQWYAVINTNLNSLFNMTRPVIDGMRERGFGRIINISSVNGQKGQMGQVNYSASKAGDLGFTKALAQENANKGITVNAICPGYIATEMVMAVPKDVLEKSILPQIAVRRLGQPEEIARCVVFLAADEAGFVTGATLSANGGQLMT